MSRDLVERAMSGDHDAFTELAATDGCCPVWSPDGRALLFMRGSPDSRDLFTVTLADESIRQVTHTPGNIASPDW